MTTFAHAAFDCTERAAFERRLTERGVRYRVVQAPVTNQVQLFFHDPAGNGVELGFDASDGAR
jgi:extradiol dioxygenase family protein